MTRWKVCYESHGEDCYFFPADDVYDDDEEKGEEGEGVDDE